MFSTDITSFVLPFFGTKISTCPWQKNYDTSESKTVAKKIRNAFVDEYLAASIFRFLETSNEKKARSILAILNNPEIPEANLFFEYANSGVQLSLFLSEKKHTNKKRISSNILGWFL